MGRLNNPSKICRQWATELKLLKTKSSQVFLTPQFRVLTIHNTAFYCCNPSQYSYSLRCFLYPLVHSASIYYHSTVFSVLSGIEDRGQLRASKVSLCELEKRVYSWRHFTFFWWKITVIFWSLKSESSNHFCWEMVIIDI